MSFHTHSFPQMTLIGSSSDREVSRYFIAVFKRLSEDKQSEVRMLLNYSAPRFPYKAMSCVQYNHGFSNFSQVAISFAMSCLSHSVSSVRSWCKLFPSLPFSSQVLLKELAGQEQLSTDLPLHEISHTLSQIVASGSPEEKTLAQVGQRVCVVCAH